MTYQQKTLPTKGDSKEHIVALDVSKTKKRWVKAIKDFHRRNRVRTGYVGAIDHRLWYLRIYDHFWHRRRLANDWIFDPKSTIFSVPKI